MASDAAPAPTAATPDRYDVEHDTRYSYRVPVSQSWQLAHLTPCRLPWQRVVWHELAIEPPPDERHETRDSFGNGVTHFGVHGPHPLLRVRMLCEVEVSDRPDAPRGRAAGLGSRARLARRGAGPGWLACRPHGRAEHARAVVRRRARLRDADLRRRPRLARRRHRPDAPHPPRVRVRRRGDDGDDVGRRGARAAPRRLPGFRPRHDRLPAQPRPAGALRLGLPADAAAAGRASACSAPTSRTPGSPRIRPSHGWVEFDPTNDTLADRRYITLATGADFADVVPLRGVILGGRGQTMKVAVSIVPK